eukprot:3270334-Prymnesium_polylepis.1
MRAAKCCLDLLDNLNEYSPVRERCCAAALTGRSLSSEPHTAPQSLSRALPSLAWRALAQTTRARPLCGDARGNATPRAPAPATLLLPPP